MDACVSSCVFAIALCSCIATEERVEPLYPITGSRPARDQVAQIGGYLLAIDDQPVAEGKRFEVLPGCHIVRTPARWGRTDSSAVVTVDTGHKTFAILMRPGHSYLVEVKVAYIGSIGSAVLSATEKDATGTKKGYFGPITSDEQIDQCKELGARLQD